MQHVFLVHSAITELVARRVIEHLGLERDEALLWRYREPAPPPAGDVRGVFYGPPLLTGGLRRIRRRVRRMDDEMRERFGDSFHLYVPQVQLPWIQVATGHPACKGYSYIEEGMASYYTADQLERKVPRQPPTFLDHLRYRGRLIGGGFFEPGHAAAYGMEAETFPSLDRRIVVGNVFEGAPPEGVPQGLDWVLAVDHLDRAEGISAEAVLHGLQEALAWLRAQGAGHVHVKLHPTQQAGEPAAKVQWVLDRAELDVRHLPTDLSLERLAASTPESRFVVGLSSVGLYAAMMGRRVVTNLKRVAEVSPAAWELYENFPESYRAKLEVL